MTTRLLPPRPAELPADLALVGDGVQVPLVTGGNAPYVNLDNAASTPCLAAVWEAVEALLPWYSSVHRGAGYKSQVATAAYETARDAVHSFLGARPDDTVVFTRNTTDALNMLAAALPPEATVVVFGAEHHANLLPWRRRQVTVLPIPPTPEQAVQALDVALAAARGAHLLVAVTGASNVTGEIWPYAEMARVAHQYGARVVLDAAQLAPHRSIDMSTEGIDYLALSGHKLYAPFGAGALVGRQDWLAAGEPFLAGGGAVRYVGLDTVLWAELPDRQEAGTPNVVGAVALGVACRTLQATDREAVAGTEAALLDRASARLAAIPGVERYRMWAREHPRIGVLPFTLRSVPYALLAAVLSAEYGVGVRHGCFCAHPLMVSLLGIDPDRDRRMYEDLRAARPVTMPGAVRASIGLGTTEFDIDRFADALEAIATDGPRWSYRSSGDGAECWPDPDPRPLPFELTGHLEDRCVARVS